MCGDRQVTGNTEINIKLLPPRLFDWLCIDESTISLSFMSVVMEIFMILYILLLLINQYSVNLH